MKLFSIRKIKAKEAFMKALTIWQPYADAIAKGLKHYETRCWRTHFRGTLAIHAACRKMNPFDEILAEKYDLNPEKFGQVVAFAEITDCILMTPQFLSSLREQELDLGFYKEGRYAWKLENIRLPHKEIIIPGKQGLWNLDDALI